jgi:hypothetical protein|eukprot:COSAG02_NODE_2031_length_10066_cov_115.646333_11_plen_510_part_00
MHVHELGLGTDGSRSVALALMLIAHVALPDSGQHALGVSAVDLTISTGGSPVRSAEVVARFLSSTNGSRTLLAKKFQAYNAGCVLLDRVARDVHLLRGSGASMMRVDTGLGWSTPHMPGVFASVVQRNSGGKGNGIHANMAAVLNYTTLLASQGVKPLYAWSYTPRALQPVNGSWTSGPRNLTLWAELHRQLSAGLRGSGAMHEIYNEPDLGWALDVPWSQYLEMYRAAATGLRAGDPEARIVGPAIALYPTGSVAEHEKLKHFLDFVKSNQLPLDALSIHAYGAANWRAHLQIARKALAVANMTNLPIQFTEINVVNTAASHALQKLHLDNYTIAAATFGMIAELIQASDVEQVYWAQFLEPGASVAKWGGPWGTVDIDGNVLASYNAFAIYARMPTSTAVPVDLSPGTSTLASCNDSRASLVVWSTTDAAVWLSVRLTGVSFAHGRLAVYRIDARHSSFSNMRDPAKAGLQTVSQSNIASPAIKNLTWAGNLPARAVVYFEINRMVH